MSSNKLIVAVVGLSALALPAQADVIVRQVPTMLFQQIPVLTRTTTVVFPAPAPAPATIQMVVPLESRTITSSAVIPESTLGSVSNFAHRLSMLRDQIAAGEQAGLLRADVAAGLNSRYQSLAADLSSNTLMSRDRYDAFEQQINLLNQDVSNAMTR